MDMSVTTSVVGAYKTFMYEYIHSFHQFMLKLKLLQYQVLYQVLYSEYSSWESDTGFPEVASAVLLQLSIW